MVDQKILNLELYTKEKIIDLISQINLLKNVCKCPSINDQNKLLSLSNSKYKTFNNSFNGKNTQNFLVSEKIKENKENISINNENKNIVNTNNISSQVILNNIKNEKRRYSLKEINPKTSLANTKTTTAMEREIQYSRSVFLSITGIAI